MKHLIFKTFLLGALVSTGCAPVVINVPGCAHNSGYTGGYDTTSHDHYTHYVQPRPVRTNKIMRGGEQAAARVHLHRLLKSGAYDNKIRRVKKRRKVYRRYYRGNRR